ncbi:MAG: VWA domain-containing protein [Acidobacteria bacterium]|nr:VWA domain-containing protein [Acidobacteriota bacterium]
MELKPRMSWVLAVCMALFCPLAGSLPAPTRAQEPDRVLTIVEPDQQTPLAGIVRMRAEVVPAADVARVEFFVNGVLACTAPAPAPFECVWDAGNSSEARIVRVVARFGGGGRLVRSMRARGRPAALFSAGTDVVLVPVVVQDRRRRFVGDLTLEDFELFEDGVRQDASFFQAASIPLDLVLAIDFSASMTAAMGPLRFAARHFISELPERARLGLIAFNDRTYILARQEQNRTALMDAVDVLPAPFGGTALLDAMSYALDLHGDEQADRVVVLFSDGDDRHSFSAVDRVEERIRASQATVYVVTMGRGREMERVRELLGRLTQVSGGRAFSIERIEELDGVLAHIRDRLQNRYFLAFQSSNPARDGTWRRIEVRTSDRRHVVAAREGYLADAGF